MICSLSKHQAEKKGFDIDEVLQDVKNSVDAIYSFPNGAEKPRIQKQQSRGMGGMGKMVGFYALTGPDNLWKLKETADQVERDLSNLMIANCFY